MAILRETSADALPLEHPVRRRPQPGRRRWPKPNRVGLFLLMCLVAASMLYPFYFMANNSLRTARQYESGGGHSLSSWAQLFSTLPIGRQLLNSLIVTTVSIALLLAFSSTAGFAFAKLRFRGSTPVFLGVVGGLLIPLQSIIVPLYSNIAKLGILNGYLGAILVYTAYWIPFATFLMTTYFRSLPDELVEASIVDGHGYPSIFMRIALPMSPPALVTVIIWTFVQIWDDLLIGLLFLQNPNDRPITVGLATLSTGHDTSIPLLMAGSLVSAIPAVVVYLLFQKHLVKGLTLGIGK